MLGLFSLKKRKKRKSLRGNGRTTSCATSADPWLIFISINDTHPRDNLPLREAERVSWLHLHQAEGLGLDLPL